MENNSSINFVNNFYSCFIPPITNLLDNHEYDGIISILNEIFNELSKDKNFKYKFNFRLFMHSNDKNKNLESVVGPSLYCDNILISPAPNDDSLIESALYREYRYHGYGDIYFLNIDFNDSFHNAIYIKKIIEVIEQLIPHLNKNKSDLFIEDKKWIILDIDRIPISMKSIK